MHRFFNNRFLNIFESFFATSLSLLKSTGRGINLAIFNLSTLVYKPTKFVFNIKLEVSTCEKFFISAFVA